MGPSQQPTPERPYALRPADRWNAASWLVFVVVGIYLIHRGTGEEGSMRIVAGVIAILLGVSQAAFIAIRPLRPWGRMVRVAWAVLILGGLVIYRLMEILEHPR
jgi:hypothetical protein